VLGAPEEILPGVDHWTAYQPELKERVSSYYVEPAGALIDPMVPEAGLGWFETPGVRPQQVVPTSHRHWRETDRFAEAFRCLVRCPLPALKLLEHGRTREPFNDADEAAPGVTAIEIGKLAPDQTALHVAAREGAIAFGDALIRPAGGPLAFCPPGSSARTRTACATACGTRSAACCCATSTRCCSRTASRCRTTATPPCAASSSGPVGKPGYCYTLSGVRA
jgi:hypothetical protein